MSDPAERYRLRRKSDGAWLDYLASEWDLIVIPPVWCKCDDPILHEWKDGRTFCTKCGYLPRATEAVSAAPGEKHE